MALWLTPARTSSYRALALAILFVVGVMLVLIALGAILGLHGTTPSYEIVPDPWTGPVF